MLRIQDPPKETKQEEVGKTLDGTRTRGSTSDAEDGAGGGSLWTMWNVMSRNGTRTVTPWLCATVELEPAR